jgi:hypothetical protein
VSKLPLEFTLRATTPFRCQPSTLALQPGEAATVSVSFDPCYRSDLVSHVAKQRCLIAYADNPQKDWLELSGSIEYPNLVFDSTAVDFGCILLDSLKRAAVAATNPGTRPVRYSWSWLRQDGAAGALQCVRRPARARSCCEQGMAWLTRNLARCRAACRSTSRGQQPPAPGQRQVARQAPCRSAV